MKKSLFKIACQSGGGKEATRFDPLFRKFKKCIEAHFQECYSREIDTFSIIFRVDGKYGAWGEKGCNRLRLMTKKNYVTIDIGITHGLLSLTSDELWSFVQGEYIHAMKLMTNKLHQKKIAFPAERLLTEINNIFEIVI